MTYITILGRQSALSIAELEQVFGSDAISLFSDSTATVESESFDIQKLGGTLKAGHVTMRFHSSSWNEASKKIAQHYIDTWRHIDHKQTLGLSVYDWKLTGRDLNKLSMSIKSALKKSNVSLRVIPNSDIALNTAVSHHNKLGLSGNKVELLIVRNKAGMVFVAESIGAQNITALARRDQGRPKRDAFVGMLPPKLALMMVNMAGAKKSDRILDPFCGTGVVLQEAMLLGYDVYGTDLSEKMIDFSTINLTWLKETHHTEASFEVHTGDAIETRWHSPIGAVVAETYLGQPFSAPPAIDKLEKVVGICDQIITRFLQNIGSQLEVGTSLCLGVPAWRDAQGNVTRLPLTKKIGTLGYERTRLSHVKDEDLLYYREDQIVAREILILKKR